MLLNVIQIFLKTVRRYCELLVVDRYQGIGIGIGRYHMVSVSADTAWYRWPIPIPQKTPTFDSQTVFELNLL